MALIFGTLFAASLAEGLFMFSASAVISAVVTVIILGLVFWLLWWLVGYIGLPEPFRKVANVVLAVAAVLLLISILLGLAGMPVVRWP